MYNHPYMYPYQNPYYANPPGYTYSRQPGYCTCQNESSYYPSHYYSGHRNNSLRDYGREPFVININEATKQNNTYRTAIWTGEHLQTTLMSIDVGDDIGLEIHPDVDQFLRIEQGQGIVQMGKTKNNLNFQRNVFDDSAIFIPAGTWHNVTNTGQTPHLPIPPFV
ncbi:cupin domain-containing protein [Bacillus salacetis]|uniref:cupin domain-containing protein n=1 Tax=Bacillus salacetis TaxID=2315464 RepID=UPI003B9FDF0C